MDRHREITHVMWPLSLNCLASDVLPNLTLLTQRDSMEYRGGERQTQMWVQILALTSEAGKSLTDSASLSPSVQWA